MITTRGHRNSRYALLLLLCLALIGYFSYHAVKGDHGLDKRTALETQIKALEGELADLKDKRIRLEHDVALMTTRIRSEQDLLDEQARGLLNFVHPDDIAVMWVKPVSSTAGDGQIR